MQEMCEAQSSMEYRFYPGNRPLLSQPRTEPFNDCFQSSRSEIEQQRATLRLYFSWCDTNSHKGKTSIPYLVCAWTETRYHNRLNAKADTRIQLSSIRAIHECLVWTLLYVYNLCINVWWMFRKFLRLKPFLDVCFVFKPWLAIKCKNLYSKRKGLSYDALKENTTHFIFLKYISKFLRQGGIYISTLITYCFETEHFLK